MTETPPPPAGVYKADQATTVNKARFRKWMGQKESLPQHHAGAGKKKAGRHVARHVISLKNGVELCADGLRNVFVYVLALLLLVHICVRYSSSSVSILDLRMFHLLSEGSHLES